MGGIGSLEVWRLGSLAGTLTGDAKLWRETADCADWLQIKGVLAHAGRGKGSLEVWRLGWHAHCDAKLWEGTADSADWSRLGAGCRRQDRRKKEAWKFGLHTYWRRSGDTRDSGNPGTPVHGRRTRPRNQASKPLNFQTSQMGRQAAHSK